nr:zinc finger HIT domain-containing protein 1 [Cryptococcus depauperatus CBS 7841]
MASIRRNQPRQSTQSAAQPSTTSRQTDALLEFQARRIQRRLDDLERTNPTDIPSSSFVPNSTETPITGPLTSPLPVKKKQTANVRRILYNKKSLKDWLDELVAKKSSAALHHSSCSASKYPSSADMLILWIFWIIQMPKRYTSEMEGAALVDDHTVVQTLD